MRAGLPRPHDGFMIPLAGTSSSTCHHKILQLKYEVARDGKMPDLFHEGGLTMAILRSGAAGTPPVTVPDFSPCHPQ